MSEIIRHAFSIVKTGFGAIETLLLNYISRYIILRGFACVNRFLKNIFDAFFVIPDGPDYVKIFSVISQEGHMKKKHPLHIFLSILRNTHTYKILIGYVVYVFLTAFLILITDESIDNYGDALWYCYAVLSTAGFGDVVVTGFLPKILSVILTIYSAIVIAIVTGAIVNLYSQITEETNKETLNAFLDQLENLPELNHHELSDLSKRIQSFRDSHSK